MGEPGKVEGVIAGIVFQSSSGHLDKSPGDIAGGVLNREDTRVFGQPLERVEFEGHPFLKDYPADRTQPLVPYRTEAEAGLPLEKLAPFGRDEGMPFPLHGGWGNQNPREN